MVMDYNPHKNMSAATWKVMMILVVFMIITTKKTEASILKTDSTPNKCVVSINGRQEIRSIGELWNTTDPCIKVTCETDDDTGTPYEKPVREICALDCKNEYEMQPLPNHCCGECVKTKCKYENRIYSVGLSWSTPDKCTLFECTNNTSGDVQIESFVKFCPELPEDCPQGNVYEENCCKYCRKPSSSPLEKLGTHEALTSKILSYGVRHPCARKCLPGQPPMRCEYEFKVEWFETMSKACYNCPFNQSDCSRPHCIPADGVRRSVMVINRMMPGPAVEVCLNDIIVVDVENHLLGESTTIHWHGLHQRDTPYMDGVPHVSQCPISPHTTFRYEFVANQPGTHFWHSHTGMQRGDGCFGALVIRQPKAYDPQSKLYDFDLREHTMIIQDWGHLPGVAMFSSHHHSLGDNKPPNILINGKGRYFEQPFATKDEVEVESQTTNFPETETLVALNESQVYDLISPTKASGKIMKRIETVSEVNPEVKLSNEPEETSNRTKRSTDEDSIRKLIGFESFTVKKGFRYRFRVINAEFLNCPIQISVDNHTLLVISSDGYDFEPIEVKALVTYAGERFDFILDANQPIQNYWIRFKGLMDCDERFTKAHQTAILRYEGAVIDQEPNGIPSYEHKVEGLELNSLNAAIGEIGKISLVELSALDPHDEEWVNQTEPDFRFYVYYDFYAKDNPQFHVKDLYGFDQIESVSNKLYTPQLNHISFKMPPWPLMPARDLLDESLFCNATSLSAQGIDCHKEFCECSHVLQVPLNSVVEMILIDEGVTYDANHPFHLHGNSFRVVAMDRIGQNITIEEVERLDKSGQIKRKLTRSLIKDTITVPDGGYTIIRVLFDNPGYWLFHCHIEFHAEIGMALVFKVGKNDQMTPVPEGFPMCGNYIPKPKTTSGRSKIEESPPAEVFKRNSAVNSISLSISYRLSILFFYYLLL